MHVTALLDYSNRITVVSMCIEKSSRSTTAVPGVHVDWRKWKTILSNYFRISKDIKITEYQWFCVRKQYPGVVFARKLHDYVSETEFNFLIKQPIRYKVCIKIHQHWVRTQRGLQRMKPLEFCSSENRNYRKHHLKNMIVDPLFKNSLDCEETVFCCTFKKQRVKVTLDPSIYC